MKLNISGRPVFALVHRMSLIAEECALITERYFYSTHSLNSLQFTITWLPYEDGTYMGLATSASADILSGFKGKILRAIGRNKATKMVGDVLKETQQDLEQGDVAAPD